MGKAGRKPLNFYMCESVYTAIAVNLKKHKSTRQAILWFIAESETFTALAEGNLLEVACHQPPDQPYVIPACE